MYIYIYIYIYTNNIFIEYVALNILNIQITEYCEN